MEAQLLYVMLILPTFFGLSLLGEGIYRMTRYESGWVSVGLGCIFLMVVVFGYFFMTGYVE
ncbi:hypothetical protein A2899_02405 [Candidatus Amesbacteria bacterium RIFCSPLOWO2_01_FULL_49_25]|uniref:NADH-quinone oxidoreductase subunit L n=1 Tax=Candidatus Amesbacteria bacterium RIFCSPHIGHO2_01_FULL_48_32b TaxID=1797253 RepID=A0A1F4YES0_9BACT|nr:MAG: hypothetical protein A2876_04135 [Candidatus Amesbacteria bacterium RIFCSPHIGHO2_01_FULL_48_32b]OGD08588.1 MAG: hypothetical protein A2899_02405 [Candidatus Amesbacteria bacterium RIFCSPLOWO2_01_FULL_49_25]